MTDVVCGGCASPQPAGTQYCGVCGREFPRTGRAPVAADPGPRSAVQQQAGSYGAGGGELPYHQGGGYQDDEFQTGTFVPKREPAPVSAGPAPIYAHVGRRIVAFLIDGGVGSLLFGAVYGIALLIAQPPAGMIAIDANEAQAYVVTVLVGLWGGIGLMVLWVLAMLIWEGKTGKTLGNISLGIRTVSAENQQPIGFWRAALRMLVVGAGNLACGVGSWIVLLSPLWDAGGRKQGWHDKAGRTIVIDTSKNPALEVAGFHPEARPASAQPPASVAPAPAPVQGGLAPAQGPAGPGSLRAAGQGHAAASAAQQSMGRQSAAPQAPTASFTPEGAPAQPDPWAFPSAQPAAGGGLITDVPGTPGGGFGSQQPDSGQPGSAQQGAAQPGVQQSGAHAPQAQQPVQQQPGSPSYPAEHPKSSTPSPPATPNSALPVTAANTIPEHPMLETSPYPPISQPQHRESQPTRAANIDQFGHAPQQQQQQQQQQEQPPQQHQAPQQAAPGGRHTVGPDGDDATRIEPLSGSTQMHPGSGAMDPPRVTGVVLELESGQSVRVDGPTLVGRNPQAPGSSGVNLIQIGDPMRSVSKNHAELGIDSAGLWLTDRGSTNGTVVSVPGLPPRVAEAGARVRVPVGSTIHFGDRRVVVHPSSGQG